MSGSAQKLHLEAITWNEFPDIEDVKPIGDNDHKVLEEIREVLLRNNYENRFGVFLIHKHFDMDEDEYLVEHTDHEKRSLVINVKRSSDIPEKNYVQTSWKFSREFKNATVCERRCQSVGSVSHRQHHMKVAR